MIPPLSIDTSRIRASFPQVSPSILPVAQSSASSSNAQVAITAGRALSMEKVETPIENFQETMENFEETVEKVEGDPNDTTVPPAEAQAFKTDLVSDNGVKLLDTIDDLRRLGIDKDIPLPQIVVVGSQSAGKSSVLEAISGIAFPVNEGLCTTFASEIRLRRAKEETLTMSIVSKLQGRHGVVEKLQPLTTTPDTRDTNGTNITWDRMPSIIDQAANAMSKNNGQEFSEDILRIEVSGPAQDHLSLIDLPGIFHVPKPGQDPAAPERVKSIVERYMREKRSIILAVVSAKGDFATQEILKMVERIDPSGIRTMGIITGVDTTSEGSVRESDYIALARNELVPLALGWHVVRNLSFADRKSASANRDALESQFFANRQAWLSVPEQDRGAPELKKKLSQTLLAHIGRELGGVIGALDQKIIENDNILEQLGPQRETIVEKRNYLIHIGDHHEKLTRAALDGAYNYDDAFFANAAHCLRAKVVGEFETFEKAMENGHRWEFWAPQGSPVTMWTTPSIGMDQMKDGLLVPHKIKEVEYVVKVGEILQRLRANELAGHFNPELVAVLFKDQSCRWKSIAREAINRIVSILKRFLENVTFHLAEPRRAQLLLQKRLLPALRAYEQSTVTKLDELIKPFQKSLPRTYNPRFQQTVKHLESQMMEKISENKASSAVRDPIACYRLALSMQSYYEIARATFVDNVVSLGVELCLLDGLPGILAPSTIPNMTDDEVDEIASEFPDDTVKRIKAQRALEKLRTGRDLCREYDRHDEHPVVLESDLQDPEQTPPVFNDTANGSRSRGKEMPSRSPARRLRAGQSPDNEEEL